MGRPIEVELRPTVALDADGIALSQTPAAGGVQSLTLNGTLVAGGVYTADIPRRITVTSAGDETARTFTITGTNRYGEAQSEAIAGLDTGAAETLLDFATVTGITTDDDTALAITAGISGKASSAWISLNTHVSPVNVGFGVVVSGVVNYDAEHTFDSVQGSPAVNTPAFAIPAVFDHADVVAETTDQDGNYAFPPVAMRVTLNSFTLATGVGVRMRLIQAGVAGN